MFPFQGVKMDMKIFSVLIVYCINLFECSFFQISNSPSMYDSSQVSPRNKAPYLSNQRGELRGALRASHNSRKQGDQANNSVIKHRQAHSSNRARDGRKKTGKPHRQKIQTTIETTTVKVPVNFDENSDIELFDLQELSPGTDDPQFSDPNLNKEDEFITYKELSGDRNSNGRSAASLDFKQSNVQPIDQKKINSEINLDNFRTNPRHKEAASSVKSSNIKVLESVFRPDPIIEESDMLDISAPGKRSFVNPPKSKIQLGTKSTQTIQGRSFGDGETLKSRKSTKVAQGRTVGGDETLKSGKSTNGIQGRTVGDGETLKSGKAIQVVPGRTAGGDEKLKPGKSTQAVEERKVGGGKKLKLGKSTKTAQGRSIGGSETLLLDLLPGDHENGGGQSGVDQGGDHSGNHENGTELRVSGQPADLGPFIDFPNSPKKHEGETDAVDSHDEYERRCNAKENEERKRMCERHIDFIPDESVNDDYQDNSPNSANNVLSPGDEPIKTDLIAKERIPLVIAQNRKLATLMIKMAIWPTPESDNEPKNGFKILNTTKTIFSKICPGNVISPKFLQSVVLVFKLLHDITTPARTAFIDDVEYDLIDRILQECYMDAKPANYIQNECKEEIMAVNKPSNLLCLGYMVTVGRNLSTACYQTNLHVFDPVLDIVWLMFESVKATCFHNFQGNVRLFHRYSIAIMDLFTTPLKYRWALDREGKEYWERMLGPGLLLALANLDKCAQHIVDQSVFDFRTPRYLNTHDVRFSRTHTAFLTK